jgi:TonB-linked SusC/RagA family outer membrane protein
MNRVRVGRLLGVVLLAGGLLGTAHAAQAQQGAVTGQVVDRATQRPLSSVQVIVSGTNRGTITNAEGRYLIPGVAAGTVELRAVLVGYEALSQTVTVRAGESVVADFGLAASVITLDELVVTATGTEMRKREIGNAVATIAPEAIEPGVTSSFSQVLNGRTAGVTVLQAGGTTGSGTRIRIRGSNSVSLSNDPLIIVDGVIVDSNSDSHSIGLGGQSTSRINDFNSQDIEKVEVLKGPAASALYGTAAANGVIQITTKRGRSGQARWNAYAEYGTIVDPNTYADNYKMFGTTPSNAITSNCNLENAYRGACAADSLVSFNPLEFYRDEIFRTGTRAKYGLNVSGGSDLVTYYLSGDYDKEDGVYANNFLDRINLRANLNSQLRDNLDVAVKAGFLTSELSLPQNDNNTIGLVPQGILGNGVNDVRQGFYLQPPSELMSISDRQGADRFTGALTGNWRPLGWLSLSSTAGMDLLNRFDNQTVPPNKIKSSASALEGSRTSNRFKIANYSFNLSGSARYGIGTDITANTSVGVSYLQDKRESTTAFGAKLLAGTGNLNGTNARFSVGESYTDFRQVGTYLQQQLSYQDRFFLTGSLRGDDNSAFGQDFGLIFYPSVSASWVLSEESFFPVSEALSSLRLRAAYGRSGLRPGFRDAPQYYSPVAIRYANNDIPGITVGGVGNPNLKPERTSEYELGFEASFFADRMGLDFTYYNKTSQDALISRRLAPSLGVSTSRFENIGEVSNKGVEALVNAMVLNTPTVQWDVTVSASTNQNKLVKLGEGIEPIIFGLGSDSQRHQEDYPLGGYWTQRIKSWEDKNGDGIISRANCTVGASYTLTLADGTKPECEVILSEKAEFIGKVLPGREASFSTSATLSNRVRLYALLDYKGDYMLYNSTQEFRCTVVNNCRERHDATAPLADQAKAIANLMGSYHGYFEDASFMKLREVAVTLIAPQSWAHRMGMGDVSLTLSGRNLHTWTKYSGLDPEINYTAGNFNSADFMSQPPLRYYTARVTVNF